MAAGWTAHALLYIISVEMSLQERAASDLISSLGDRPAARPG